MKVPLLDLKLQYQTIRKEMEERLLQVAESQYFILGPEVEKMEKALSEYLECKYAIGVSSGTDALLIALMALDIKPDDEIILPTFSFFATAGVVVRLNAKPVFVDCDPITFNIDVEDVKRKITKKTKAIIPVHLFGQSAEMDILVEIAKLHSLFIIEDGAQAIGVQYKDGRKVGCIGDIGCFSFFPSKNLGCFGDGGLVTTNNEELGKKLRMLRVHGMEPKYYHKMIGGNFRLDAIQAAVINVKLPLLDGWSEKRRNNADLYNTLFIQNSLAEGTGKVQFDDKNKVLLPESVYKVNKSANLRNYHIFNQYVIRIEKRDELKSYLVENGIGVEVYYPVPFHKQECFDYLDFDRNQFPVSDRACENVLALPIFPELINEQIEYVVMKIKEFFTK